MLHFFCALHCEAKPIIKHFELKRSFAHKSFEHFRGPQATLSVCGVGKLAMAFVVGSLSNELAEPTSIAINFGSAGCGPLSISKGSLHVINAIEDMSTKRRYYPDLVLRSELPETSLQTFDHPVSNPEGITALVDMEASGFFSAAQRVLPPHRIVVLKFISDYLSMFEFKPSEVELLASQGIQAVVEHASKLQALVTAQEKQAPRLNVEESEVLCAIVARYQLTDAMEKELAESALSYAVRHGSVHAVLEQYRFLETPSKEESKKLWHELLHVLAQ